MLTQLKPKLVLTGLALTLLGLYSTAQASLVDRGNSLLYDNVLNVTWLQDANYAKTSGYDADGMMDWDSANAWAANLVYGGYSDWRLATNTPINGSSFNTFDTYNGTTDFSFNITSPNSELAYMYHVNLGLKDRYNTTGATQANFGVFGNGTLFGQAKVGLVNNLQSYSYWSGAEVPPGSSYSWAFSTFNGGQFEFFKDVQFYAWAVRSGDVAAVPVPGALWLFGSGLIGLLSLKRRGNIG